MPITKEIFCPKLSMRRYQRTILVNFQGNKHTWACVYAQMEPKFAAMIISSNCIQIPLNCWTIYVQYTEC